MHYPVPDHLVAQAADYADGTLVPAQPRNAATVVLLRESSSGPQVYLLRRHSQMAFAPGMAVFPGGGVDQRDFSADDTTWVGPSATWWASVLGCAPELARALVCAAVRETFEESGVLLAGASAAEVVGDTTGPDWESDRQRLVDQDWSFSEFLVARGLVLRSDLLRPWSGWLTPVFEPRRYRTWFFVAALPTGQRTRDVSTESSSVVWLPLAQARRAVADGELLMLPPTYLTCVEMGVADSVSQILQAATGRTVEMFTPEVVPVGDGFGLSVPPSLEPLLESAP